MGGFIDFRNIADIENVCCLQDETTSSSSEADYTCNILHDTEFDTVRGLWLAHQTSGQEDLHLELQTVGVWKMKVFRHAIETE